MVVNIQNITMSEDEIDTVYIQMPDHPGRNTPHCVKTMIQLNKILTDYDLPMVNLDFDENKKLIGIEVLV